MEREEIRMKTIVLPGYSIKNKYWAYEVESHLSKKYSVIVHEWKHWEQGLSSSLSIREEKALNFKQSLKVAKRLDIKREVETILEEIIKEKNGINIIAKSIGTKVAMSLVPVIKARLGKVILCGIPIDPLGYRRGLKTIGSGKLLVIQNSKDPFMPYRAIRTYMKILDKNIKVVKKPSDTHDYPYYEDFAEFLGV